MTTMATIAQSAVELDVMRVLHALADPVRLQLVRQLWLSEDPIVCGHFETTVAKSTLSHHLKILRDAGIMTTTTVDRARKLNTLRVDELDAAFPGLLNAILPAGSAASR